MIIVWKDSPTVLVIFDILGRMLYMAESNLRITKGINRNFSLISFTKT